MSGRRRATHRLAPAILLCFVLIVFTTPGHTTDKRFWYGLYNVFPSGAWGWDVYDVMQTRFRMNWLYGDASTQQKLDAIKQNGLQVINGPYFGQQYPDSNKVGIYSFSFALRLSAKGDGVNHQWSPDNEHFENRTVSTTGSVVYDPNAASGDSALYFNPATHAPGHVKIWRHADFTSDRKERIDLRIRVRGLPDTSTGVLAYLGLTESDDPDFVYARDSILQSDCTSSAKFGLCVS